MCLIPLPSISYPRAFFKDRITGLWQLIMENLFGGFLRNELCSLKFLHLCVPHLDEFWFVIVQSGQSMDPACIVQTIGELRAKAQYHD